MAKWMLFQINKNSLLCFSLECHHNSIFQEINLFANMRDYHLRLSNLFNVANNNINSTLKLKRKLETF